MQENKYMYKIYNVRTEMVKSCIHDLYALTLGLCNSNELLCVRVRLNFITITTIK